MQTSTLHPDWVLIPLDGKRPVLADWASAPGLTIAEASQRLDRGANVGVVTGSRSGLVVIDADGPTGLAGLDRLKAAGLLPDTLTVTTGKGLHLYYRLPAGAARVGNSASRIAPGIDVRGDGGQVVAPGSQHPDTGRVYTVEDPARPVADAPPALLDTLAQKEPRKPRGGGSGRLAAFRDAAPWPRLIGALEAVAKAPEGERNNTLNWAAYTLAATGVADTFGPSQVAQALVDIAAGAGLGVRESGPTVCGAMGLPGSAVGAPTATLDPLEALAAAGIRDPWLTFWDERPWLSHIRAKAHSALVSPDALLAATLVRASCEVPPGVVLPGIVGGPSPVSLFAAIVGPSGAGKGAAVAVSGSLYEWTAPVRTPGSGEGLVKQFVSPPEKNGAACEVHTPSVLLRVDEIDTLAALTKRSGATLSSILRSAWSGERLGFDAIADRTKAAAVPEGAYRLGLIAGVQPRRAGALLDDADGGTPQRFLWADALDPDMPSEPVPDPGPLALKIKHALALPRDADTLPRVLDPSQRERAVIPVADSIRHELRAARIQVHKGLAVDDPDGPGHNSLMRLRVAAILGLIEGRLGVTEDDWRLAGVVMDRSAVTLGKVKRSIASGAKERARARGVMAAETDAAAEDAKVSAMVQRLAVALKGHPEGLRRKQLRNLFGPSQRPMLGEALAEGVRRGVFREVPIPGQGQPGTVFMAA